MKKKLIATLLLVTLTMTTALTGCGGSGDKETAGNNVSSGGESNDNTVLENDDDTDVQDEVTTNELETLAVSVAGTEIVITEDLNTESFMQILGNNDENNDEDDFYYATDSCRLSVQYGYWGSDAYGKMALHVRPWEGYTVENSDIVFAGIKIGDSIELVKEKFGEPSTDKNNTLSYSMVPFSDEIVLKIFNIGYDENGLVSDIFATISFGEEN